jgi:hypothetical protein
MPAPISGQAATGGLVGTHEKGTVFSPENELSWSLLVNARVNQATQAPLRAADARVGQAERERPKRASALKVFFPSARACGVARPPPAAPPCQDVVVDNGFMRWTSLYGTCMRIRPRHARQHDRPVRDRAHKRVGAFIPVSRWRTQLCVRTAALFRSLEPDAIYSISRPPPIPLAYLAAGAHTDGLSQGALVSFSEGALNATDPSGEHAMKTVCSRTDDIVS